MHRVLFSIGPFTGYSYGLMIGIGVIAALMLSWRRAERYGTNDDAITGLILLTVVCGFAGAKVLAIIVHWKDIIANPSGLIKEGFVVYGGLGAGLLTVFLWCRAKKLSFGSVADCVIPGVALAQGFGRIGCFMAGCCYGKPTDSFLGVVFPAGGGAPAGIKLLPSQLFSAAGDFILAIILLQFAKKHEKPGLTAALYFLLYAIGRFCVEFTRSDVRGSVGVLSTSQFIAIPAAVCAACLFFFLNRKKEKPAEE